MTDCSGFGPSSQTRALAYLSIKRSTARNSSTIRISKAVSRTMLKERCAEETMPLRKRQRPERLIQSFSGATLLLSTTPRSPDPTNHLGTRLSSAQRAFEAAAIFSRADGFIRPALTCSVISWRLAGSVHLARMAAAIPLRLSGFPIPA